MSDKSRKAGGDIFIVDNSDEYWKVVQYLQEWTQIARSFDIATGYFEIGALLALDGMWQKLEKIRILMGDEVSKRTKHAFEEALEHIALKLNDSIEAAKEEDDFLSGVPAIVDAIRRCQIETRVYRKKKFHAKAYITHSKLNVVGSAALVGSSNFTLPGLNQNIELNIQIQREVDQLQEWYERHWEEAEDVTPDLLKVIERHTHQYTPFDVYVRSMAAYFRSHELSVSEWERTHSKIYPILDQYQREGYHALMRIAHRYNGALLCDGVGLGKTFIGLMVIERLLFERKRVALIVPKAARADVWEAKLKKHLPEVRGHFSNLVIYNHTDLTRGGEYTERMQEVAEKVDAIIIDEAHHFRNIASDRSRKLFEIAENKQLFLLTATPVNNSLYDLMHLIEYFSRRVPGYFSDAPLGIHTLRGHFRKMEDALQSIVDGNKGDVEIDPVVAERILSGDDLFQALVVQRSRAYVRQSLMNQGGREVAFPDRKPPKVANYSLVKTYGKLLDQLEDVFNQEKPLLSLAIYYPLNYQRKRVEIEELDQDLRQEVLFAVGRQAQIVGLVRTLLLKRFESSVIAFQCSCEDLLLKLLYFVELHSAKTAQRWKDQHTRLLDRVYEHQQQRRGMGSDEDLDEDVIPEEFKKRIEKLSEGEFNTTEMVMDTMLDLDVLARFLDEMADYRSEQDDKLQVLLHLLRTDPILSKHKVLIFTEYRDTARYLAEQLETNGIGPVAEIDSLSKDGISDVVRAFSPYYNESSSAALVEEGVQEIRVLVATDILAEGLNLQDATCIINYDLHWNPVRLMQRIGRVDRRLDRATEARMIANHPEVESVRGTVWLWNFLPPDELNRILSLYERVTHKTLRISKTFGIEGRKLLTPDDDYNALREFNQAYEGATTSTEEMFLAYQRLLIDHPDLPYWVETLPLRVFSGKEHVIQGARGVFFCYRLPGKDAATEEWTDDASLTKWYLYNLEDGQIEEDATRIYPLIECTPDTRRETREAKATLSDIRRKMDKHITNTYMKRVQAPAGVGFSLLAWMELT
jgi:superfamily II DNA or RNA helicase